MDGTLLNSRLGLEPHTLKCIRSLQEQKIPFVIVSARSPKGVEGILERYGFRCPIISFSGGLILDQQRKVLLHRGLSRETVRDILDFLALRQLDLTWCLYSLDQWIVADRNDPRILQEETIIGFPSVQGTLSDIQDEQINKILCMCAPGTIEIVEREVKAAFPDCSVVKSSDRLLEIMAPGVNKAAALEVFCSHYGLNLRQTLAFGDNYNDVEMLETAGTGILMGNAPAALLERLPLHTEDNDHDGIYLALKRLGVVKEF
mgnify:FL=1